MLIRTQNRMRVIDAKVILCLDYRKEPPFILYASASTDSYNVEIGKYNTLEAAMNALNIIYTNAANGRATDLSAEGRE